MDSLQTRLETHLKTLVRDRNPYLDPAGHFFVQQYIQQEFAQWGSVEHHEFVVRGQSHLNLILNLLPSAPNHQKRSPIVIGAHYDAVPGSPGADDNASGVAVLLEMARLFAAQPARSPLRFVAFDLEEYGMLGSRAYATDLKQRGESLRLMLSLEMLGYRDTTPGSQNYPPGLKYFYPDRGDYIGLIGNLPTMPDLVHLGRAIRRAGVPCQWLPAGLRGEVVPATRLSDHSPFWDLGYRALMVTDTSFMRNPHYHQPSDRLETLDLDFMTGICQGLVDGLRRL